MNQYRFICPAVACKHQYATRMKLNMEKTDLPRLFIYNESIKHDLIKCENPVTIFKNQN